MSEAVKLTRITPICADTQTGWFLLYERTDIVLRELPRLHGLNTGHDFVDVQLNGRPVVGRQFENSNVSMRQILLVAKVLVGSDKHTVFILRDPEQVAILETSPPAALRTSASVSTKMFGQRPRNALVENDPHAASRAASERSKTRHAMSLVTDGKHSMNSSRL